MPAQFEPVRSPGLACVALVQPQRASGYQFGQKADHQSGGETQPVKQGQNYPGLLPENKQDRKEGLDAVARKGAGKAEPYETDSASEEPKQPVHQQHRSERAGQAQEKNVAREGTVDQPLTEDLEQCQSHQGSEIQQVKRHDNGQICQAQAKEGDRPGEQILQGRGEHAERREYRNKTKAL
jgi:hypothetical protein